MILVALTAALASDLDVEIARNHLEEGRPAEAFEAAEKAVQDAPDARAWLTWLTACEVVGLAPACRAELSLRVDEEPGLGAIAVWHDRLAKKTELPVLSDGPFAAEANGEVAVSELAPAKEEHLEALRRGDPEKAVSEGLAWLAAHPGHPDVLLPLFDARMPARSSVGKLHRTLEKRFSKARVTAVPELFRWHRLFLAMRSERVVQTAAALEAQGHPVTTQAPRNRAEQMEAARMLVDGDASVLPKNQPGELEAIVQRAIDLQRQANDLGAAIGLVKSAQLSDDNVGLALLLTDLLLTRGDGPEAVEAANHALELATAPWPVDLATTSRLSRRIAVSKALAARGRGHLLANQHLEAVTDLMVANQLALQPLEDVALEKAMRNGRHALETVKVGLESPRVPAQDAALDLAKAALAADKPGEAILPATQAIQALCVPSHKGARLTATLAGRPEMASAFAMRARAQNLAGDRTQARNDMLIALLLNPWAAPAPWWEEWAALNGGLVTFFGEAMASEIDEEAKTPSYRGSEALGEAVSAALVSDWMRGHVAVDGKTDEVVFSSARVVTFPRPRVGGGGKGGGGARRPVLQERFPAISFQADGGTVGIRPGRPHIVTFFRGDSPSSQRLLRELGRVARSFRQRGQDVGILAVSMDASPEALKPLEGALGLWNGVTRDPGLAAGLGVSAVPTTWIVDRDGIARFVHVGYLGPSEYEAELRYLLAR